MARAWIVLCLVICTAQATVTCAAQVKSDHEADPVADCPTLIRTADEAFDQGRLQDAVRLYSSALKVDPSSSGAYLGRGLAHEMLRKTYIAIQDYRSAIRLDPRNYMAKECLASLFECSGIGLEEVPELYRSAAGAGPQAGMAGETYASG